MGNYEQWAGGEILKKMEYAGVVEPYASKELATLHGMHDVLRQTLSGRADTKNATEEGDRVYMKPNYHRHYLGFINDLREDMNRHRLNDEKYFEARKIVTELRDYLESCETEVREDPVTFYKRQYMSCPRPSNLKESDLVKLNRATSNIHRVWEQKLATSFKDSKLGNSPTPEQCMIVQSNKEKETPKWATLFCNAKNFMGHPDLSALVLACKNSGAILMRRLDVSAGENEGLHSTQILINPKEIKINPNVHGHEEEYRNTIKKINSKDMGYGVNAQIPYKGKGDMEKKIAYLSENMNKLIRPNTGMPMSSYALK